MRRWFAVNNERFPEGAKALSLGLVLLMALTLSTGLQAQGPALTTISGTVYRADGTAASGTVLISWPSFQTAEGDAVAAGNLSVTIGALGAFSAQLVPNVGATPAGTYYVVVLQLDDGTVRTEYWAVPATSPTTITAVRTTPGTGLGNLAVTQDYVNAAVANRALDATVVHLAGTETITGTKQFSAPPALPAPAGANDAANKGYVDAAVANVGSGAYVAIAGGTMTGPLTLPADPTSPNQAADRHYVDSGLAVKADVVNGMVPTGELGAGVASAATCLNGNSTWGSCGGGAPAGITYATTALNWTETISSSLTGGSRATVTLTPCPVGIDTTSGAGYQVLVSGGGNSEAVSVATAAGGCTSGAASGTITFTPYYSYAAGYTIGSASSGLQETFNAGCGTNATAYKNSQCNVTIPANGPYSTVNTYNVAGTIYWHSNQSVLSGYGTSLNCLGRGACLQIGDLVSSNDYTDNTVAGLSFRTPVNLASKAAFAGVAITQTQQTSQAATITTASAHGFRVGDMVTILFTDSSNYWGDATITAVPSATTFQYAHAGADIGAQASPGVVALAYVAVLDNAVNTHLIDISYDKVGENGAFNNFFDFWDDENATIEHFNNQAISLNNNANWTGSFVFSAGNQAMQVAPVITLRDSTITANYSNGVTDYNSNGLYIENTVVQATGPWQVYASNSTGSYQGAYLKNIYSESTAASNPLSPARSPFPGLGIAGLIAGASRGSASFGIAGNGTVMVGAFATGGTGSTPYSYFIVANDTTTGTHSSPMQVLNWESTGSDSIPVRWPRVANGADTITYDVIRTTTPSGPGTPYPYTGGCPGGSGGTCGYVALGLSQATACSGGLVCTYTDSGASSTAAYTVNVGNYTGLLAFWPGAVVTVNKTVRVDVEQGNVVGVGLNVNPSQVADQCANGGTASSGGYTTCLSSPTNSGANQTATLITDNGPNSSGQNTMVKGRLNFSSAPAAYLQAHHIITLIDSQPALTQATQTYRPPASANDTWIGTDAVHNTPLSSGQLAFGAPVSITNYIAQTGDGTQANWLERLSASLKEFNVAVKFDQGVTLAGLSNGCLNVAAGVITSTGSPCGSGGGGGNVNTVFGRSGAVVAVSGDYSVSQVTGAAADAAVVHNTGAETIAGAKTFTSNVTMSGNLLLPQGNGFVPAAGGIGLDTTAGLPVVNIGGTTHQVAFTSSNISGQAGTAVALAGAPTQCSGSFATGIAANGNANCTTPDVIQLAETTQPAGIPNWGVFWFDSATHTPRVIENSGQVIQLGLTNLFNSDPGGDPADNLEERNGNNAQSLRVYSSYVNNTTWQRTSLGFDAADGYAVVRSENGTSGSAAGLGLWIGSGLKWVVDAAGNLKPWAENTFTIGTPTYSPSIVYAHEFCITTSCITSWPSGGAVGSVFGRTGAVTAQSGDYTVAQVTGAAADSAVVHLAGAETISGAKTFSSNVTLSGNLSVAGSINQTGTGPTQWSGVEWAGTTVTVPSGMNFSLGVGSDGTFRCQLTSGASCMASAGGMVYPGAGIPNSTGSAWGTSYGTSGSGTTLALTASPVFTGSPTVPGYVTSGTTVNGHALSSNVTVSASDLTTGTLPHGQLPALVAGDIPNNGANTTGTAANLSGTPALPSGTTAVTQTAGDNSAKVATDALVFSVGCSNWMTRENGSGTYSFTTTSNKASIQGAILNCPLTTTQITYYVIGADNTANTYDIGLYNSSGTLLAHTGPTAGTTFAPSASTFKTISWTGGPVYLLPGKYYLATTTSCSSSCATMGAGNSTSGFTFYNNTSVSVTAGGTLNAISAPSDSPSVAATIPAWWIH